MDRKILTLLHGDARITNNANERVHNACGIVSLKLRAPVKPETVEMLVLGRYILKDMLESQYAEELGGNLATKHVDAEQMGDMEVRFSALKLF